MILRNKRFQPEYPVREPENEFGSENGRPPCDGSYLDVVAVQAETQQLLNESEIAEEQDCAGPQSDGYRFSSGDVDQKKLNDGGNLGIFNGHSLQEPDSHEKESDAGDRRITRSGKVSH